MPLIKEGRVATDPWSALGDADPLPEGAPVIVSLSRWLADREVLLGRGVPVGIRVQSHERVDQIIADLGLISLITLEFPTFRDGRAYSNARLLRERYGYAGELRAVGDVLRDQFLFMHRCGFDAFEVKDDRAVAAWSQALAEFSVFYQPTGDGRLAAPSIRHLRKAAE